MTHAPRCDCYICSRHHSATPSTPVVRDEPDDWLITWGPYVALWPILLAIGYVAYVAFL